MPSHASPSRDPLGATLGATSSSAAAAAVAPAAPQRPATAPNTRVRLRQYQQLVQQLSNTIAETKRPAPKGVDPEVVAQRRSKLERVLRDVQEEIVATKTEQRNHQNQRFCKAARDQMQKEVTIDERCAGRMSRSQAHSDDYWSRTIAYRHHKNEQLQRKTEKAEAFLQDKDEERRRHNQQLTYEREQKLQRMQRETNERRAASARRHREIQEHNEELLRRKQERDHAAQMEKERKQKERDEELKRKEKLFQERKAAELKRLEGERSTKRVRGNVNKVRVTLRPQPVLSIVEKDHEQRLQDLEEADRQQRNRYAEEEATRAAIRHHRKMQHQARQDQRDKHATELFSKHMEKAAAIKQQDQDRSDYVKKFRRLRSEYYQKYGEEKQSSVVRHMQQADSRRAEKVDSAFKDNYRRWNRRADNVMDQILSQYETTMSKSRGGADQHHPGGGQSNAIGGETGAATSSPSGQHGYTQSQSGILSK